MIQQSESHTFIKSFGVCPSKPKKSYSFTSGVCSLRLDFETFSIQGTGNTVEADTNATPNNFGGQCTDTFDVTVRIFNKSTYFQYHRNTTLIYREFKKFGEKLKQPRTKGMFKIQYIC